MHCSISAAGRTDPPVHHTRPTYCLGLGMRVRGLVRPGDGFETWLLGVSHLDVARQLFKEQGKLAHMQTSASASYGAP